MMRFVKSRIYIALLATGLGALPLFSGSAAAALEQQQQGAVSFVSGGVGEDESQAMKRLASDYPLELLFVAKGVPNEYLADVKVQIMDKSGNVVLDTTSNGPFLLAKMPPGKYTVTAESDGTVKKQTVSITGGKTQRMMFVWDQPANRADGPQAKAD